MTSERVSDEHRAIATAIFDPGAVVGMKGDRTLTEWQVDAVMASLQSLRSTLEPSGISGELPALSPPVEQIEAAEAPPVPTKPMVFMTSADEGVLFDPQGKFHGWAMWQHPDGIWVSLRKLDAKDPEDNPLIAALSPDKEGSNG